MKDSTKEWHQGWLVLGFDYEEGAQRGRESDEMRDVGTECDPSRKWPSEFVVVLLALPFSGGCFHF
jgi:hypothetical protein